MLTDSPDFWLTLDGLVVSSGVVIDRPRGRPHPDFPELIYPFDYGYLKGTSGGDGAEIDVWLGSSGQRVTAVLATVDPYKRDAELKVMLGCTESDLEVISNFLRVDAELPHLVIRRPQQPA